MTKFYVFIFIFQLSEQTLFSRSRNGCSRRNSTKKPSDSSIHHHWVSEPTNCAPRRKKIRYDMMAV